MNHVTVVVPAFNAGRTISRCLESVRGQDWTTPHDVIVVDDGSVDDTAQIAGGFDGVRVIRQKNAGPSAARNAGVRASCGNLIAFLDADDAVTPGGIQARLRLLEPGIDLLMTTDTTEPHDAHRPSPTIRRVAWHLGGIRSPSGWMVRRALFESIGGFNERLRALEDVDFAMRVLASGGHVVIRDCHTFVYSGSGSGRSSHGDALVELASLAIAGDSWASAFSSVERRRLAKRYLGFAMNVYAARSSLADVQRAQRLLVSGGLSRTPRLLVLQAYLRFVYQRARQGLR